MKVDAVIFDVDGTLWDTTDLKREFGKPMNEIMDNLFPGEEEQTKADVLIELLELVK